MPVYTLPDLPYDYGALEPHYSAEQLELHHDKHHAQYVTAANEILEKLAGMREAEQFELVNHLERELAFNVSGHVLHSVFWQNLSPDGGGEPAGALADRIGETFGSFDSFRAHLTKATLSVRGSGWGALAWEPVGGRLIIEQMYDHQGNVGQGAVPLLVIDIWEHAFYAQYRTDKAGYVDAIWNVVDWHDVAGRFEAAQRLDLRVAVPT